MGLIKFLAGNSHIVVSKPLIHLLGLNESILLGELCAEYVYWEERNKLEEGFFPSSVENIERQTGLTKRVQQPTLKNLADKKILEIKKDGYPARRLIKIDENAILAILTQSVQNESTDGTVGTNCADINKNNSIYISKYDSIYSSNYNNINTKYINTKDSNYNNSNYTEEENKKPKKKKETKPKEKIYTLGEFQNVKLTLPEIDKLSEVYGGDSNLDSAIDILDGYIEQSGHKYKSHYAVLRKNNWVYNRFFEKKR